MNWHSCVTAFVGGVNQMSNAAERDDATSHFSTTSQPVVFVVSSDRAESIARNLSDEYQEMYLQAWRDAVSAVMEDCGWGYESPDATPTTVVERIRTGRPRVIHGTQIDVQLSRAIKAVDDYLESILVGDAATLAAVRNARRENPVSFSWRMTERYSPKEGEPRIMELLSSRGIDITEEAPVNIPA